MYYNYKKVQSMKAATTGAQKAPEKAMTADKLGEQTNGKESA